MELKHLVLIAALVAAFECVLILAGVSPPVSTYSAIPLVFLLVRYVIIASAGWILAKSGLKTAAVNGALVAAASAFVFILAAIIGRSMQVPVLGISVPDLPSLILVLIINLVVSVILGATLAVVAAFIALRRRS